MRYILKYYRWLCEEESKENYKEKDVGRPGIRVFWYKARRRKGGSGFNMTEKEENPLDLEELRKTGVKGAWKKFDKFTDKKPSEQMRFWVSFYKPIVMSLVSALLPSIVIGALLKYYGKFSDFEISVLIILVFISSRINNMCGLLSRLSAANTKLEKLVKMKEE
jgi:hypothetical protein